MNFVQPYIFWGLPIVALPILIHLLNRLRYRSVKWAAMMFLLSATKSSVRRARLRHYLVLALRTLAILFLLLALARPIAGGWLGAVAGGAPETIFLVLDRSASMETMGSGRKTLRTHAVEMLEEGAGLTRGNVRFVLAESAGLSVQEVPSAESLSDLSLCRASSSAADLPALLEKVLEYAVENRCGDLEVWIASDMQASNWRVGSPEWQALSERFSSLPQSVRFRVLSLVPPVAQNVMTALRDARRVSRPGGDIVNVSVSLERNLPGESLELPVTLSLEDAGQQEDIRLAGISTWLMRSLPLTDEQEGTGWGAVQIPADGNNKDNKSYFAYGGETAGLSALVAGSDDAGRVLRIASAPDPKGMNQVCLSVTPADLDELQWPRLGMLVWQAGEAGSKEALLESFCRQGGTVVMFPPGRKVAGIFGIQWGEVDAAAEDGFSVVSWESSEGPLARSGDGKDLPVSALEVGRRQSVGQVDDDLLSLRTYATYRDGRPFLQGARLGEGQVFICTTLPSSDWSNLARGTVLVPMMQRFLSLGTARLGGAENSSVGMGWKTAGSDWVCVDSEDKDPSTDAGIYRIDGRLIALNVPETEHDVETVGEEDLELALQGLDLEFVDSDVGKGERNTVSEIWPLFVFLMGLALLGEAAILSGDRLVVRDKTEVEA